MGSLIGTITGGDGTVMTVPVPRVYLIPTDEVVSYIGDVLIGATRVTLATDGSFAVADVPDGLYRVRVLFYDPPSRAMVEVTTVEFPISGTTYLASALSSAALTGPVVTAFALDTDGRFYYDSTGAGTHSAFLDTDGNPYIDIGAGGEDVYEDTDGTPVILTAS